MEPDTYMSSYLKNAGYSAQIPETCCRKCCFFDMPFRAMSDDEGRCVYHDYVLECLGESSQWGLSSGNLQFDGRGMGICRHFCTCNDMLSFKDKSYNEMVLEKSIRAGTGPCDELIDEVIDGKDDNETRKATDKMQRFFAKIVDISSTINAGIPPVMIKSEFISQTGRVIHIDLSNRFDKVHEYIKKNAEAAKAMFAERSSRYSWRQYGPYICADDQTKKILKKYASVGLFDIDSDSPTNLDIEQFQKCIDDADIDEI